MEKKKGDIIKEKVKQIKQGKGVKQGKSKKWMGITLTIVLVLAVFLCFFMKNDYKIFNLGNTKISKTATGMTEYILNMSSYEAEIELTITSNKNTNQYKVRQKYASPNIAKQEILEPSNIQGLTMLFDGTNLKIENTKLSLTSLYENYKYVAENNLFLNYFVEDYKNNSDSKVEEKEGIAILTTKCRNASTKYAYTKKLYIDIQTAKPIKMEVQDINQSTLVYILYNEIKINSIKVEDVLAHKANDNPVNR